MPSEFLVAFRLDNFWCGLPAAEWRSVRRGQKCRTGAVASVLVSPYIATNECAASNPRGGANGSGKTTFARQYRPLLYPGILLLNADEIQREGEGVTSSVAAGRKLLHRLQEAETSATSFAVETTLASRMYLPHVRRWSQNGFQTILHFIEVPSADFAVKRVQERVSRGGHPIDEKAIRRRHLRGINLFVHSYRPLFQLWYHWKSDDQGLQLVTRGPDGA